jgi:8-oxo-dGTP diphosphatase
VAALVTAAGGVLHRPSPRGLQIVLVHRPRYDDWSLPKGKTEAGESAEDTARREVLEETGYVVTLGVEVGSINYEVKPRHPKSVRYWLVDIVSGAFAPSDEVDVLEWVGLSEALTRVTHQGERQMISRAFDLLMPMVNFR